MCQQIISKRVVYRFYLGTKSHPVKGLVGDQKFCAMMKGYSIFYQVAIKEAVQGRHAVAIENLTENDIWKF